MIRTLSFKVHGMDCADEITTLKRGVGPIVGGEENLSFNLLEGKMTVTVRGAVGTREVEDAVARTGMRAVPWQEHGAAEMETESWRRHRRSVLCAVSGALVTAGAVTQVLARGGFSNLFGPGAVESVHAPAAAIALYLGAVVAGGWYIAPRALLAARRLRPDMNLLMTIAALGAMLIGEWFEAGAVTFLFALALLLESWSVGRARRAIRNLLHLSPTIARVIDGSTGRPLEVAVDEVAIGSRVLVRPGEKFPLDGTVVAGSTTVNQAPITGESMPVPRGEGDPVYAGTINGEGAIEFQTTSKASDTTVAHIIRMVEEAQARRSPTEQWVERFARTYTPLMMGMAVLIAVLPPLLFGGAWSQWFYQALVLLVIACPCALVISTPVSVVASLASAAKHGVLIKGGRFLEIPARLRAVAVDKTGTLTLGRPEVIRVVPFNGHDDRDLLEIAAAVEGSSAHPLAEAIVRHASASGIRPEPARGYQAVPGKGATAELNSRRVWLGSHRYLEERAQESPELHELLESLSADGASVVVVGNDEHVCGVIALADRARAEARAAVAALRAAGVDRIVMLTGDNGPTARAVARQIGIEEVRAELLPQDKLEVVDELVARNRMVAMVGDGVNDAPAMARATIGIAMGAAGSDAAIETADIALMGDDLSRLPWLVSHSRRTLRIIKENIAISIALKVVFVVLTLTGHASLWAAIAADMGVSLLVVMNALRLLQSGESSGAATAR
jgi:Cd2+/Zn2+-exporting ATPase